MPGGRPQARTDTGGGLTVPLVWPSLPASAPLTEPNLPFLDPTDKFPTGLSAPDFGALLIRLILAEQPLGPVNASRAPESFLYRGEGPPDAGGSCWTEERPCYTQRSGAQRVLFYRGKETLYSRA